jgi:hypothetical protein
VGLPGLDALDPDQVAAVVAQRQARTSSGSPAAPRSTTSAPRSPRTATWAYADSVAVATEAGAAIRWARAMREPGAAVILDTVIRADGCLRQPRRPGPRFSLYLARRVSLACGALHFVRRHLPEVAVFGGGLPG